MAKTPERGNVNNREMKPTRAPLIRRLSLISRLGAVLVFGLTPLFAATLPQTQVATNAFTVVDLSRFASAISDEFPAVRALDTIPSGWQTFHGVPFVVRERIFVTGIDLARNGEFFPTELIGIPIGKKAQRLHLLHGALSAEKDGVPMAKLVFHYASGAEESVRLGYGIHGRYWLKLRTEKKSELADPNSAVAWSLGDENDRSPDYRLFQTAINNPRPDEVLANIDLVSLFSRAAPFIVGLSVETGESGLPPNRPLPSRKMVHDLNEFGDSVYRGELTVHVTDGGAAGTPLTNAVAMLSVTDDQHPFTFGEAHSDANGVCRLPYPPQQTVAFHLHVRAPGRVPKIISESRSATTPRGREFLVALSRGVPVGGVVKAANGGPISGAQVALFQITKTAAREYTRTEYDLATTEGNGKWSSSTLPAGFEGFSFEVTHPDFRPALYVMPGQATGPTNATSSFSSRLQAIQSKGNADEVQIGLQPLPDEPRPRRPVPRASRPAAILTVTSNALLAATAEMTLQPAILVSGIILDSDGKPLAQVPLLFQRHNPSSERKNLQTDARGEFRLMTPEPGDGAILVVRRGQNPKYHPVNITPGMKPLEITLASERTLRGRVMDRQQRPVAGATVRLDDWMGTIDVLHFQTLTDEEGRFTWVGAPTDQVMLYVTKSNYYTMRHSTSGQKNDLTLYLNRPPGVSGKVYDVETKEPIDLFTIIKGRKYSTSDPIIRWERGDMARGRNGEYSIRVDEYYFQPEARIMVEAPGYIPQISRGFAGSDSYTADFALKKGKGIRGIVKTAAGQPAANATVVLVDKNDSAYMDMPGQFRSGSYGGDFSRTDATGHFEFSPKLESDWILVCHERGFAEMKAEQVESNGTLVLQPWARVNGVMRVGDKPEPDQTVRLQNQYDRYYEPGHRSSGLSLYLKAEPDASGQFVFEKVPPGERRLFVEYRFKERQYGETPLSHGLPLSVKPGETMNVTLGGSGRKVTGHIQVIGGEQTDVDWRRDVHKLTLILPPGDLPQAPDVSRLGPEERQKAWEQYNIRQREFWQSDAGRRREHEERTYVLVFETNGQFRVDHVPPGKYLLSIIANDPEEEYYRQRMIGSLNREVEIPDVAGAKVNEPFDLGTIPLTIQAKLRIGKMVAPLETKSFEGAPLKLSDYRGKYVLLFFWSTDAGTGSYDLQVLKEMHNTFGKQEKLVILGLNLDADAATAAQFVKNNGMLWPQASLGEWSKTQVPASFGVDGIPTGILIDGEGRLVARNLRGSSIRTAIRNALNSATGPTAVRQ